MRYVYARFGQHQRDWAFRIYVTDALKYLAGLDIRYADVFDTTEPMTSEEVVSNIRRKFRESGGE